jgi:hypothetical protein
MDIPRIAGKQGTVNDKDLASPMRRGVEKCSSAHLKRILETWIPLRLLILELLEFFDVLGRVATHITNPYRNSIPHTDYAKLGYWVLFEVFRDEFRTKTYGEEISCRPQIFLNHSKREVKYENKMSDDASL